MSHMRVVQVKRGRKLYYRGKDGYWDLVGRGDNRIAREIYETGPYACTYSLETSRSDFVTTWRNLDWPDDCETLERMFLTLNRHMERVAALHRQWHRQLYISLLPGVENYNDMSTGELFLMVLERDRK